MKEKVFFLSDKEFVIDREIFVTKAPMSDVFT